VRGWGDSKDEDTALLVQAIITVIARAQRHDDSWFLLASDELGIPESVLRDYAAHGDSLPLAILIHVTRQQLRLFRKPSWPGYAFAAVLEAAARFNAHDTSPELQSEFCVLWNQIVLEAQNAHDVRIPWYILRLTRSVYIALHQGTQAVPTRFFPATSDQDWILLQPSTYPLCSVPGHHVSTSARLDRALLHDNTTQALVPSSGNPKMSSSSAPSPLRVHVDGNRTDMSSFNDNTSVSISCQPAPPPGPLDHSAYPQASSEPTYSPVPTPVLGGLPVGLPPPSVSAQTESDNAPSWQGPRSSFPIALTPSVALPWTISSGDMSATVDDDGAGNVVMCGECS